MTKYLANFNIMIKKKLLSSWKEGILYMSSNITEVIRLRTSHIFQKSHQVEISQALLPLDVQYLINDAV